jgi:hypothetical protein
MRNYVRSLKQIFNFSIGYNAFMKYLNQQFPEVGLPAPFFYMTQPNFLLTIEIDIFNGI